MRDVAFVHCLEYYTKIENRDLTEKPCMNILMPYHFGQLMTCTKSWHIFFPAHIPLKPIFASPEPWIESVQEPNDFFMLQFFTKEHIYVGVDAFQFPQKAPLEMLGKAEKQ